MGVFSDLRNSSLIFFCFYFSSLVSKNVLNGCLGGSVSKKFLVAPREWRGYRGENCKE